MGNACSHLAAAAAAEVLGFHCHLRVSADNLCEEALVLTCCIMCCLSSTKEIKFHFISCLERLIKSSCGSEVVWGRQVLFFCPVCLDY